MRGWRPLRSPSAQAMSPTATMRTPDAAVVALSDVEGVGDEVVVSAEAWRAVARSSPRRSPGPVLQEVSASRQATPTAA